MFCVYILKSKRTGKHYIGQTNDFQRRFEEHNKGKQGSFEQSWYAMACHNDQTVRNSSRGNAIGEKIEECKK